MRREFRNELDYVDWLKSLGCILYSPFQTDATNLISGKQWYSAKGIPLVLQNNALRLTYSSNAMIALAQIDEDSFPYLNVGDRIEDCHTTILGSLRTISPASTYINNGMYCCALGTGGSATGAINVSGTSSNRNVAVWGTVYAHFNGFNSNTPIQTSFHQLGYTRTKTKETLYADGVNVAQRAVSSWALLCNSAHKSYMSVLGDNTYNRSATLEVKDLYVFERAITDEDVSVIYAHDNV